MLKERDASIDILKCLAALVITNSHMDMLYGKYSMLATGGAIGDVLFFFCSGYTLILSDELVFFNWYKRRINRIYPSIFAFTIIATLVHWDYWQYANIIEVLITGREWFIVCIMLYYIIFWFVRKYAINHLEIVSCLFLLLALCWYRFMGIEDPENNMYGLSWMKWIFYFVFMLMGAMVRLRKQVPDKENNTSKFYLAFPKLILSLMAFYALFWLKCKDGIYDYLQIASLIPLGCTVYYSYQLCNTCFLKHIYTTKMGGWSIKLIGGLCLEIYLVQPCLFTNKMNFMFPLNLFIMFFIIVIAAYMLRCFARIWSQTFKDGNYDWKAIVKI